MFKRKKKQSAIPAFWLEDDESSSQAMLHHIEQTPRSVDTVMRQHPSPSRVHDGPRGHAPLRRNTPSVTEPRSLQPPVSAPVTQPTSSMRPGAPVAISVNIQLPSLHIPKVTLPKLNRRHVVIAVSACLVIVVTGAGWLVMNQILRAKAKKGIASNAAGPGTGFSALAPAGEDSLESSQDLYVDSRKHTVNFQDNYGTANIIVSQQAVPESFRTNPNALQTMALSLGAKEKDAFDTVLGKMYVVTKHNDSPEKLRQFAILKTETALVMMQATKELKPDVWRDYLASLHTLSR